MGFRKILLLGVLGVIGSGALLGTSAWSETAASATTAVPAAAKPSAAPQTVQALTKTDADIWLDGYMPYALHTGDIPGAVVVVVKDGQILTARGFGYADVDKRTPVDPNKTMFRPGSVSKLVTWTAVMQLVEKKKIDLDADVNNYLDFKIAPRNGQPVTMRQLMTHTAGFEETIKNLIFYDPARLHSLGDTLKAWVPERILDAGATPAYSNYGTALAGYIVERVSGEPFDDYLEKHIFDPLGMRQTSFRQPLPAALAGQMATGYSKNGQVNGGFEIVAPAPAGSMSATGADMGRYMLANLQHGELDGKRILSAETAAMMHNSPLDKVNPKSLISPLNRMELGFFETNINGREVIGHLGDTESFHTSLHLFMKEGVGFYVSFNSGGKAGASGTLRSALFQDFSDRYFTNTSAPDGSVDAQTAKEHARMMTGDWMVSRRSESTYFSLIGLLGQTKIEVNAKGELLVPALVGQNGRPREWVEIAPFVWRDKFGHDRFAAQVVDGQPVRWSMDFMSPFMAYDRVPTSKSGTWIKPALYVSLAVIFLTFLSMPLGWIVRRKYGQTLSLTGAARKAYKATQISAGLNLVVLGGWVGIFALILTSLKSASDALNPWLWLLQLSSLIVFIGAVLAAAWNLKLTWTDGRNRKSKLWSLLLLIATLVVLYVAFTFGMLAFKVNY